LKDNDGSRRRLPLPEARHGIKSASVKYLAGRIFLNIR
jgi:hypothetical protein